MPGQRLKLIALTALTVSTGAAHAADYSQPYQPPPPPPVVVQQPEPEFAQNWYLRGYVGVGINQDYDLEYLINPKNSNDFHFEQHSIDDTFFLGGAVGYEWNNWLRFDVSAEYRAKTGIKAYGSYTNGGTFGDSYEGNLKSWVFLVNAFVDLGTWECFTPFVGAGVGGAYVTMADLTDIGIGTSGRGTGRNSSEWNFAWALYAGVGYSITKNFNVDFTYRYLSYGQVTDTIDCEGGCYADSYKFSDLHSHDFMIGLRWTCCDIAPPPPRYVYRPPPPPPPPISSRG
jgi:opacity protein-like surface antigen